MVENVHHRDYHRIRDPIIGARRVVSDSHVVFFIDVLFQFMKISLHCE